MDYEYYYNNSKNRFYNACSEINSCENKINVLINQKNQIINEINQLKTDIKNNQTAIDNINEIHKKESAINSKITIIANKTNLASQNFSGMASSENITRKNLNDVYSDGLTRTKSLANDIFVKVRIKKNKLNDRINGLYERLNHAESELNDIVNRIKNLEYNMREWKTAKWNASIDMEYYKRKMNEIV